MKVKSVLKFNGSSVVEILDNRADGFPTLAILDYRMCCTEDKRIDGLYYGAKCLLPNEILERNVDFFTCGSSFDHENKYVNSLRVFVK